jgi:hypothetical protein
LSLGWFWTRTSGCSVLYRGPGIEQIDFDTVLIVGRIDTSEITPPNYLSHESSSTYFYTVRRYNHCGYREHTLAASAKVSLNAEGQLDKPLPNKIFAARAKQVDSDKVLLSWFYCPLEQDSQPGCFNIYYDNRTGQVDYENPLAAISYKGQKFYCYESDSIEAGKYLFAIRAEDTDGNDNRSSACLSIELDNIYPDAIDILQAETV